MSSRFNKIDDTKFDFIEVELRNEMRKLILKAGRRKIVFVEGYDDKIIFEIVYEGNLERLHFIDTSMEEAKRKSSSCQTITGGCETVKNLLKKFVKHLPNEKRFYGVIDRDLKLDEDIQSEMSLSCYNGRLFIFFERYTLENYFIEIDILCKFLHDQSMHNKKLISLVSDCNFRNNIINIVDEISECLTKIGAANLTIRTFDDEKSFLEKTIACEEIETRLLKDRLKDFPENDIKYQFNHFKFFIRKNNYTQKFASGKTYFSYQFNQHLKRKNVNIQLNNHKSELAKIMKEYMPDDFKKLLNFILKIL
ncbi:DUF4435 domain-containing protein [Candidatus Magnetomoraceae bacterium gMMP-1]